MIMRYQSHPTAVIDQPCQIGDGTKIWHFCHIMPYAVIGKNCVLGQNVHIASGVIIGDNCHIQNNVSIFEGVELEDNIFVGPSAVFTNVLNPRAEINQHGKYSHTLVRHGATIGANATILCGHIIGKYALIGAGSVVTKDVPDYAIVYGNPARHRGRVCQCGHPWQDYCQPCPNCGLKLDCQMEDIA